MEPIPQIPQPSLIVITGRPGSGKTTLSHLLAREVRCPLVSRDEMKEGFIHTAGAAEPGDDIGRQVYETFFDTVKLLLTRRITLIAEAAFQHKLWAPKLEPLRAIARVRIIVCSVDHSVSWSRRIERDLKDPGRQRFHPNPVPATEDYDPPHLDVPTLMVDASNGYQPDFQQLVSFAMKMG